MSKRLVFTDPSSDPYEPRIGGRALLGGVADWPVAPDGVPLMLIASIPNTFIVNNAGFGLPLDCFTSIFSYYSEHGYFLDQITYHGDPEELSFIRAGATRVIQHRPGREVRQPEFIPPRRISPGSAVANDEDCGSRIGGVPGLLQNETLALGSLRFALQLLSSDFPGKYSDVFGLADAVGYLYLDDKGALDGLFFAQTT